MRRLVLLSEERARRRVNDRVELASGYSPADSSGSVTALGAPQFLTLGAALLAELGADLLARASVHRDVGTLATAQNRLQRPRDRAYDP